MWIKLGSRTECRMHTLQPSSSVHMAGPDLPPLEKTASAEVPHVLFLIDSLWFGGGELALAQILRNLPADRYRASVITFRKDPILDFLKDTSVPVLSLPIRRTYDWNALRVAMKVRRFIIEQQV